MDTGSSGPTATEVLLSLFSVRFSTIGVCFTPVFFVIVMKTGKKTNGQKQRRLPSTSISSRHSYFLHAPKLTRYFLSLSLHSRALEITHLLGPKLISVRCDCVVCPLLPFSSFSSSTVILFFWFRGSFLPDYFSCLCASLVRTHLPFVGYRHVVSQQQHSKTCEALSSWKWVVFLRFPCLVGLPQILYKIASPFRMSSSPFSRIVRRLPARTGYYASITLTFLFLEWFLFVAASRFSSPMRVSIDWSLKQFAALSRIN